jgi:hypothetical protein
MDHSSVGGTGTHAALMSTCGSGSYNTERPHSSLGYRTPHEFRDASAGGRVRNSHPMSE